MNDHQFNKRESSQATVISALVAAGMPLTRDEIHKVTPELSLGDVALALDELRTGSVVHKAVYRGDRPSDYSIDPAVRKGLQLARKFPELLAVYRG